VLFGGVDGAAHSIAVDAVVARCELAPPHPEINTIEETTAAACSTRFTSPVLHAHGDHSGAR